MSKDDLVQEIAGMLVEDTDAPRPWRHLVMIAQVQDGGSELSGFAYQENGKATPVAPDNFEIIDKFEELREAMLDTDEERWKACLMRIDRSAGKRAN